MVRISQALGKKATSHTSQIPAMPGGPSSETSKAEDPKASDKTRSKTDEINEKLKQAYQAAKPYLDKAVPMLQATWPYCVIAKDAAKSAYVLLKPYYNDHVGNCILGFVLLFLGGNFAMTIACYQIFRATGQAMMSKSWVQLKEQFNDSMEKLNSDPDWKVFDTNSDGKISPMEVFASITELSKAQTPDQKMIAYKKISLLMKCIDPNKVSDGLRGLGTGIVAMLAALRSRFIQALTVGANLGKNAVEIAAPYARPKLNAYFPGHIQWVDFGLKASGTIAGCIISMLLIRMINSFNAAFQGAKILVDLAIDVAKKRKIFDEDLDSKLPMKWKQGAVWLVAMIGFLWQLKAGFSLPFLLAIPLLPFTAVESCLGMLATVSPV